jgi:hypothetical protein
MDTKQVLRGSGARFAQVHIGRHALYRLSEALF